MIGDSREAGGRWWERTVFIDAAAVEDRERSADGCLSAAGPGHLRWVSVADDTRVCVRLQGCLQQ